MDGIGHRWWSTPSVVLFLAMFAAQSSLLVLTPVLPDVAAHFEVSAALAAQLRSLTGVVAGGVALWVGIRSPARPLRDLLTVGLGLLTAGAILSAAAPSLAVLATGQLAVGIGLGVVLPTALAAAGGWDPQNETTTLAWALAGQPVAWVVGMPVVGLVAETSWRHAWLAVPAASGVVALASLLTRPRDRAPATPPDEPPMWHTPGTRGWAAGELLAYGGWAGTLVFVGALLIDGYQTSTTHVGLLLAIGAAAYVPGNFLARRWAHLDLRRALVVGALVSAAGVAALGAFRPHSVLSSALFAGLAFVAGARTFLGSAQGLRLAPHCRLQSMSFRTAAVQYGYLLGAVAGGAAITFGGFPALGVTLGLLFVGAAVPHLLGLRTHCDRAPLG